MVAAATNSRVLIMVPFLDTVSWFESLALKKKRHAYGFL